VMGYVVGDRSVSSEVGESVSMESPAVMGWAPVFATKYSKSFPNLLQELERTKFFTK